MVLETEDIKVDLSEQATLVISINGKWTADEFSTLFRCINHIYAFNITLMEALFHKQMLGQARISKQEHDSFQRFLGIKPLLETLIHDDTILRNYKRYEHPYSSSSNVNTLEVTKIKFNSPGGIDFFGIAGSLSNVMDLIKHYIPNKKDKAETKKLEMEAEKLRQESLSIQIKNLNSLGFKKSEIQKLILLEELNIEAIGELATKGLIKGVKLNYRK